MGQDGKVLKNPSAINYDSGDVVYILVSEIVRTSKLALTRSTRDYLVYIDMTYIDPKWIFISKLLKPTDIITRRRIANKGSFIKYVAEISEKLIFLTP